MFGRAIWFHYRIRTIMIVVACAAVAFAFYTVLLFAAAWAGVTYLALACVWVADVGFRRLSSSAASVSGRERRGPLALLETRRLAEPPGVARPWFLAIATSVMLIALWPLWRDVSNHLVMVPKFLLRNPSYWQGLGRELSDSTRAVIASSRKQTWEAWSQMRLWVSFVVVTALVAPFTRYERPWHEAFRRLLIFAPWIAVLELGHLFGFWLALGEMTAVPEPSTLYGVIDGSWWPSFDSEQIRHWCIRDALPSLVVGVAYFRGVAGWGWRASIFGGLAFVPIGVFVAMLWSELWLEILWRLSSA